MNIQDITFEKMAGGFGGFKYQMLSSGKIYAVNTCADNRLHVRRASADAVTVAEIAQICRDCTGGNALRGCPLSVRLLEYWENKRYAL